MKTELDTAWETWRTEVESLRELLLSQDWIGLPGARASALTYLQEMQAAAYNLAIAPRRGYPALYQHTVFQPLIYPNSLNCADFIYRYAFLDGARVYRIHGRPGTGVFADLQSISKLWGMPGARKVGSCDLYQVDLEEDDGSFEVIVGGPPRDRNWLPLDPG